MFVLYKFIKKILYRCEMFMKRGLVIQATEINEDFVALHKSHLG